MTLLGLVSSAERRGLTVRRAWNWLVVIDRLDRNRLITIIDRRRSTYLMELQGVIESV